MKTIQTKLYSYKELSTEAQETVIKTLSEREANRSDDITLDECMDSLKAIAEALGVRLLNWNIGPYNRNNFVKVNCDESGNKALARVLRVLINHGYERPKHFKDLKCPGVCGFTGVCFDEDIIEAIWESLLDGNTLGKAFDAAGDRIARVAEQDCEYRQSKECILDYLDQDAEIYTEDGKEF